MFFNENFKYFSILMSQMQWLWLKCRNININASNVNSCWLLIYNIAMYNAFVTIIFTYCYDGISLWGVNDSSNQLYKSRFLSFLWLALYSCARIANEGTNIVLKWSQTLQVWKKQTIRVAEELPDYLNGKFLAVDEVALL